MSQTTTTGSPSPTGACGNLYDTPVRDAVCAMPFNETNINFMSACCKDAEIVSYYDDCGLYCLAEGQSVEDLIQCLYDEGAEWEDVFCRGSEQATATGNGRPLESSDSRVVEDDEREDASSDDNKDEDNEEDDGERNETDSNDLDSAATTIGPKAALTVSGVLTGALLLCGTLFVSL